MNWSKKTLFFWTNTALVIGILNMLTGVDPIVAIISFTIYTLSISTYIGTTLPRYVTSGRTMYGALIFLSAIILLNVAVYYPYKITEFTSIAIWILPLLFFALQEKRAETRTLSLVMETFLARSHVLATLIFIGIEIHLFRSILNARTTDVLVSPWQALSASFFIWFAIATALLLYLLVNKKNKSTHVLSIAHFFLISSIAPIIYTLGYGFDGIIHRVTESWIAQNGFIEPKNPFYIGQYGLVVWLHHVLQISIQKIDIYLVPVLASVFLPLTIVTTLKTGSNIKKSIARALFWVLPILFFVPFHLTTPHNLAILFMTLTIFLTFLALYKKIPLFLPLLTSIATITIHPLMGAPLFSTVVLMLTVAHFKHIILRRTFIGLGMLTIAFLPATMFSVYLFLSGNSLPTLNNPLTHIGSFIGLFKRPFWYQDNAPLLFELIYLWQWLIAPVMIALGVYGCITHTKRFRDSYLFLTAFFAWFFAAFFLRSWIVFPDVHELEQGHYPMRLIIAGSLFLLPFMMYGAYDIGKKLIHVFPQLSKKTWQTFFIITSAIILMLSLYFTYPQRNQKVHFGGFNITQYDYTAVEWIHNQHEDYNYIVLANSITSVTALEKYSFAKHYQTDVGELFYYSIPTGGELYEYYDKMLYEGQRREYMLNAMNFVDTDTAYFVVNWYWGNFDGIVEGAKRTADRWHVIGDDSGGERIYIFEYRR